MLSGVRIPATKVDERYKKALEQLDPCPFCGKKENLEILVIDNLHNYIAVECQNCKFELPIKVDLFQNNVEALIQKWNWREHK